MFYPHDWAQAVVLYNPHVTTTANSISHPAYITVISFLFTTSISEVAVLFCTQTLAFFAVLHHPPWFSSHHPPWFSSLPLSLLTGLNLFIRLFSSSAPQTVKHIAFQISYFCSWLYQWKGSSDGWEFWVNLCQKERAELKADSAVSPCSVGKHWSQEPVMLLGKVPLCDS